MASVDFTFQLINRGNQAGNSATNIIVAIPTPDGLEFDTVVNGSGYSDISKTWTIASVAKDAIAEITLRYTVSTDYSLTIEIDGTISKLDQTLAVSANKSASAYILNRGVIVGTEVTAVIGVGGGQYRWDVIVEVDTNSEVTLYSPNDFSSSSVNAIKYQPIELSVLSTVTTGKYKVTAAEGGTLTDEFLGASITNVDVITVDGPDIDGYYDWTVEVTTYMTTDCTLEGDITTGTETTYGDTPTNIVAKYSYATGEFKVTTITGTEYIGNYNPE